MEIDDLISPASVIPNLRAANKRQALQELSRRVASMAKLDEHKIFETLLERERLGTTGIGAGTAVPHGRLPDLKRPIALFARLEKPIEFDAIDSLPVDSATAIAAQAKQNGVPFPILRDEKQAIFDRFGADATPEAFVF